MRRETNVGTLISCLEVVEAAAEVVADRCRANRQAGSGRHRQAHQFPHVVSA